MKGIPTKNNPRSSKSEQCSSEEVEALLRHLLHSIGCVPGLPDFLPTQDVRRMILDTYLDGVRYSLVCTYPKRLNPCPTLSPREHEIAHLIVEGCSDRAISDKLNISCQTAVMYRRRIFSKLKVTSPSELIERMYQESILLDD